MSLSPTEQIVVTAGQVAIFILKFTVLALKKCDTWGYGLCYINTLWHVDDIINTFTALVDLSRSNFSIARAPLFQLKSAT